NVLKYNPNEDINTLVVFNDSLYNLFQARNLVEQIIYIKNGKISFRETLKHYTLHEDAPHLDKPTLNLISTLQIPTGIHPSMVDMIRKNDDSSLLSLSDLDEEVFKLSLTTGEI